MAALDASRPRLAGRRRSVLGVHAVAWGLSIGLLVAPSSGGGSYPIRIETRISPGPYYVGQEIEFSLKVAAEGERPRVVPFRVSGADVAPIGPGPKVENPGEVGASDTGTDSHRFAFRIIPRRTGAHEIPTITVRQGTQSTSSRPVRFSARPLPSGGRPKGFLGGVGALRVEAEASPRTVRAGGEFEYLLRLTGPASRGSRDAPDLSAFGRVPLGLRITRLPDEESIDPPSRTFRYRVRATRAGSAVLPPVAVASFDPKTAHYLTKTSPGIPVRVLELPRLDPAKIDEPPALDPSPRWVRPTAGQVAGMAFVVVATLAALAWLGRLVERRRAEGRGDRFAARLARRLDAAEGAVNTARRVTEGLATYLNITAGRPPGVLTPDEAAREVGLLSQSPELAERAGRLVALCDRARYSEDGPAAEELVDGAKQLFGKLRREKSRAGEGGERAVEGGSSNRREAVGTADDGVVRSKTASP